MSNRITLWVPSKNRPCQLKALLDSIQLNAPNLFSIHVQFTYSDDFFRAGYDKLINEYASTYTFPQLWTLEQNLKEDFLTAVRTTKTSLFGIVCDDCLYFRKQDAIVEDIEDLLDDSTITFSLRLGLNCIIQDYRTGSIAQFPQFKYVNTNGHKTKFLKWDYTSGHLCSNFHYPFAQDGHIFRTSEWLDIIENTNFKNLRDLESVLCLARPEYHHKPHMVCYEYSSIVSIPINTSQGGLHFDNSTHISLEQLNKDFLDGKSIDVSKVFTEEIRGCHQPIGLTLV